MKIITTLLNSPENDPVVAILRLAYRRGAAIREKLVEQNQTRESTNLCKRIETTEELSAVEESNRGESS